MTNPILVEVTRSGQIESRHRGAIAIVDDAGTVRFAAGDIEIPVFPRSALKAIQALPVVESGAADAFGFGEQELALAQSSHGGEIRHADGVRAMLAAMGLDEAALECGAHDPHNRLSAARLRECGEKPGAIHNNCSGKHAGFLAIARHLDMDLAGYVKPDHPVQTLVRDAVAELTGADLKTALCGTDGCSIPTYAIPLRDLAKGFARFAGKDTLQPERAMAAGRLMVAALAKPEYLAGTGQFAPAAMGILPGGILVKSGAEGVFVASIPRAKIGVAMKCDDGGRRGMEAMIAGVLSRLFPHAREAFNPWANGPVCTVIGTIVGEVRSVGLNRVAAL